MSQVEIIVDPALLPLAAEDRYDWARSYFGVREIAFADAGNGKVRFQVKWPKEEEYYVDPELEEGLRWLEASVDDIPTATWNWGDGGFRLALKDAWTLHGWSEWLSSRGTLPNETVTVLHADDHDDLMSPLIAPSGDCWIDGLTGEAVDILKPDTVARSIESGAIQVGSFFALLVHSLPRLEIRHLCDTRYSDERGGDYALRPGFDPDPVLPHGSRRPTVGMEPDTLDSGGARYRAYKDVQDWCGSLPSGPVLLHIDMDFFNNRFNGDSDWRRCSARHDPPLKDVLARIDDVFGALIQHAVSPSRIDVALSPGFFPATFWAPSISRLAKCANSLHGTTSKS